VDLAGYQPFDPGVTGPLRDATREAAERHFERLMAARASRRAALEALFARNGGSLPIEPGPLGAWLASALASAGAPMPAVWTGVVADTALWLGERIVAAAPHLSWTLLVAPKKATGYQRPVLVGFRRVSDARYYVDVAHMVASWAELAAKRRAAKDDFLATIERVTLTDA
jgi:hypothetical protein